MLLRHYIRDVLIRDGSAELADRFLGLFSARPRVLCKAWIYRVQALWRLRQYQSATGVASYNLVPPGAGEGHCSMQSAITGCCNAIS